jgi:protein phosphatase slingshot
MGQSGIFPYEKDEIPWHPGTVKRTKQKIEEKQISPSIMRSASGPSPLHHHHHHHQIDAKNNNNKILCDIKKSLLIDNLTYRTNQHHHKGVSSGSPQQQQHKFAKLRQSSSVSSAAIKSSKQHTRCKSEEYLTAQRAMLTAAHNSKINNDRNNNKSQPLSASAPETFCLNFNIDQNSETSSQEESDEIEVKLRRSESDTKRANKKENQSIGKVKNLKMNFEAKANNNSISNVLTSSTNTTVSKNRKNCQSLPSSPIAIHIDVSSTTGFPGSDFSSEEKDKTVRERVECFEYGRINSIFNSSNLRQRPKSLYESKFQAKGFTQHQQRPYQISHKTIITKGDSEKRPPIPFQSSCTPTVRNALMTSNQNSVVGSLHHRKQQQGKTHPLTKLNLTNKQTINTSSATATAYNTM